tara:strand:- start:1002 stop:1850 length:849 start_codon:yes stop_codon:yes gene_type:complete
VIYIINKPSGISSFHAVKELKRILNVKKAGHCGTLDPLASGMLPICINESTKFVQYIISNRKKYDVEMMLGQSTDSYDITGKITATKPYSHLTHDDIIAAIQSFKGVSQQTPPNFSAIHINGQRAYQLARQNKTFELASRQIQIDLIDHIKVENHCVSFSVICSKGTYIRSLVNDIGNFLNVGATVKTLHRTWVEPFHHQKQFDIDSITLSDGISPAILFDETITLDQIDIQRLQSGQTHQCEINIPDNTLIAISNHNNQFCGICRYQDGILKPKKMLQHVT